MRTGSQIWGTYGTGHRDSPERPRHGARSPVRRAGPAGSEAPSAEPAVPGVSLEAQGAEGLGLAIEGGGQAWDWTP